MQRTIPRRAVSLLLALLMLFMLIPAPGASAAGALPFTDVSRSNWYYENVALAYEKDLVRGVTETRFCPADSITIAQSVTLAARMHQLMHEGRVTLENGSGAWYESYAAYARRAGLIQSDYTGRWNQAITRSEFVRIFYGVLDDYKAINTVEDGAIPDVPVSAPYAREVYAFYRAGILTGSDGNYFKPDTTIQRSEVAALASRIYAPEQRLRLTLTNPTPAPGTDFSALPGLNAPVTAENVMKILDACNPEGAYIMRQTRSSHDYLNWWNGGGTLTEMLNVAVHEQCHVYASSKCSWTENAIYVGGGRHIVVPRTETFNSLEMSGTIPQNLRTFRYSYIGTPQTYLTSQIHGPYGLLDEMTAYRWDTHNSVQMYEYFKAQAKTADEWRDYLFLLGGSYYAYVEFKYFILQYMLYARDNAPGVYNGIVNNAAFRTAYAAIDDQFAAEVEALFRLLDRMERDLQAQGYSVMRRGEYFYIGNTGAGLFTDTYKLLENELNKPAYQEMNAILHR